MSITNGQVPPEVQIRENVREPDSGSVALAVNIVGGTLLVSNDKTEAVIKHSNSHF